MAFLKATVAWYKRLGIKIERVMIDNGSYYRSKVFNKLCEVKGIRHAYTKPYTLKTKAGPSALSGQASGLGRMPKPMTPRSNGRKSCPTGCIITIGTGLMPG